MTPRERSDVCRGHARCTGTHTPREFCPVVVLRPAAWGLHGWREAADLARRCRAAVPANTGWPFAETVTRQPWWRPAGARGRACRDPRKHAPTCPARIPLDMRGVL